MNDEDEIRSLRARVQDLERILDRLATRPPPGTVSMLVQVVTVATAPTAARRFFAITPVDPGGVEAEGETPTLAARPQGSRVDFAMNLGSSVPAAGTSLLVTKISGYWVIPP